MSRCPQLPIIFTAGRSVGLAVGLAENAGIAERLDVFDVEQWLAADILDRGGDRPAARAAALGALLARYSATLGAISRGYSHFFPATDRTRATDRPLVTTLSALHRSPA